MPVVRAPAKLNLGLRILDRRPDGYHEIETVFLPLVLFDTLVVERGPSGIVLETDDPELPLGSDNLAVRAAERACAALGVEARLAIRLEKRIPVAAGLGGGSSDAAGVILGLESLAGQRLPEAERAALALGLGADVPFFLDPRPAIGRGRGERLEPLSRVPEMWWLLVAFPFPISTAQAYRSVTSELTLPRRRSSIAALLGPAGVGSQPRNDLETAAARLHPEISTARRALERAGASVTGMSGSGPTVYGCFPDREAAEGASRSLELPAGARAIAVASPGSETGNWGWGVAKR